MQKSLIAIGVVLLAGLVGYGVERLFHPRPKPPQFSAFDPASLIAELHLVRYYYDSYLPIKKSNGPLEKLYTVPMAVDGYIDMNEIGTRFISDSLVRVSLPPGKISDPTLRYQEMDLKYQRKRVFKWLETNKANRKFFAEFQAGVEEAKESAVKAAKKQGIEQRTRSGGEILLSSLYGAAGYQVQFNRPGFWERRRGILRDYFEGLEQSDLGNLPDKRKNDLLLNLWRLSQ
ncbi:MAG: DUF4230 domain-containing protein [Bacteroidota bacterium]